MRAWVCLPPVHTCAYIIQVGNEAQDDVGDRSLPADEPCKYTPCARTYASVPYVHTYAYTHTVPDHHYDKIDFSLGSLS